MHPLPHTRPLLPYAIDEPYTLKQRHAICRQHDDITDGRYLGIRDM